ncbi:MAG: ABC transporter ATP-binding protein [Candidatus Eremiobacteraeota bacterium]|nr:ABC transporter ATP-binding protein [Candidatus Eremiobacteraeota bacterium]
MNPVISVKNIHKTYKKVKALKDISLHVNRGEIFGLLGPDGAGKSSLIHIIAGILKPDSGSVTVDGIDILKNPEEIKQRLGLMPQGLGLSLAQDLSVEENIDFFASLFGLEHEKYRKRKAELLHMTRLTPFKSRLSRNLSGGMKQKLALCTTLVHNPPILILDEPTMGVDPISRREFWDIINRTVEEHQTTVLVSTAYMDEAEKCHRLALFHKGEILAQGRPEELEEGLKCTLLSIEVDNQRKAIFGLSDIPGVKLVFPVGSRVEVLGDMPGLEDIIRKKGEKSGFKIKNSARITPGLEEVFLVHVGIPGPEKDDPLLSFIKDGIRFSRSERHAVEVKNLSKRFGNFTAVDNISFNVDHGEIFGFLGPNGAGKTTTIKMLCGILNPDGGEGIVAGFKIGTDSLAIKSRIGYMSQKFSLYGDLTVIENAMLYGGIYGLKNDILDRRARQIIKMAGLQGHEDSLAGAMPVGLKQRLALGCAIMHMPEVLFLDEPTSGVDPVARLRFWEIIRNLSSKLGMTVFVTTHYMEEAENCDRLGLIHTGNIVALGAPDDLKTRVEDDLGKLLEVRTSDPYRAKNLLLKEFPYISLYGMRLHVFTHDCEKARTRIKEILEKRNIGLRAIQTCPVPFEDVFIYFMEKGQKDEASAVA